ncbi:TonB family protein [Hymenobacter sp. H14-R3]|uniref:TonB family protein n=1 Tax=Hymenobacter sp. H14-R3 TaxID=3046308 RepID=UPI0024BA577A|nr:TonB family protein [Hymenobacter sp. H14-R3]MDJ0364082.1 TonB family protein [Hymenobacter sp. H14-R3]
MNKYLLHFRVTRQVLVAAWVLGAAAALPSQSAAAPLVAAARPAALAITGRIINDKGDPLPGVFITMKDAATNATTNSAGNFLLSSELPNPVLTLKCAGYQTQTVALKAAGPVALTMHAVGVGGNTAAAGVEVVAGLLNLADEQPTYPGGVEAYRTYLQQNVRYPEAAKVQNLSGDVFVSFVVDEAGRILDAEVAKGIGAGLDEEALRLVRLMPWWTPARLAGQPVRVPATLRIRFSMQEKP